jgi:hypothetical protein
MQTSIETLNSLEAEIVEFDLKALLNTLSTQMHDITYSLVKREDDGNREIATTAPWIAFIAIAISQKNYTGCLLSENKGYIKNWAQQLNILFDSLSDNEKLHVNIIQDFIKLPEKAIAEKLISNGAWELKILPYLATTSHFRNKNIETQSNYTTNAILPIVRDYKYVKAFLSSLNNQKQRDSFDNFLKRHLGTSNINSIAVNLQRISSILYNTQGQVYKKDLLDKLKDEKSIPSWSKDSDDPRQADILAQVEALLDFLSLEATQISSKYEEMKEKLSQNKTLLINENPFWQTPLARCIFDEGEIVYICPSISILKVRLETIFIRIIDEWIKSIEDAKVKKEFESLRGPICEEYILERLQYSKTLIKELANLDKQDEAEKYIDTANSQEYNQISRADCIFKTEKFIVILECKNSLGIWRPFYEDSTQYFSSLERMLHALIQCNETSEKLKDKRNKKVFSLVSANENIWIEGAIVALILHEAQASKEERSNLNFNLGDFSFISIPMFNYLLSTNSIDRFIDDCIKKANSQKSGVELAIEAINCCVKDRDLNEVDLNYFVGEFNKIISADNENTSHS